MRLGAGSPQCKERGGRRCVSRRPLNNSRRQFIGRTVLFQCLSKLLPPLTLYGKRGSSTIDRVCSSVSSLMRCANRISTSRLGVLALGKRQERAHPQQNRFMQTPVWNDARRGSIDAPPAQVYLGYHTILTHAMPSLRPGGQTVILNAIPLVQDILRPGPSA